MAGAGPNELKGDGTLRLSTPTFMTVLVSLILAIAGLAAQLGLHVPVIGTLGWPVILVAYVVLFAGVLVRGL